MKVKPFRVKMQDIAMRPAATQYDTPTLRRNPGISRQTINQAEAGKIASANCQQSKPTHSIRAPKSNMCVSALETMATAIKLIRSKT